MMTISRHATISGTLTFASNRDVAFGQHRGKIDEVQKFRLTKFDSGVGFEDREISFEIAASNHRRTSQMNSFAAIGFLVMLAFVVKALLFDNDTTKVEHCYVKSAR